MIQQVELVQLVSFYEFDVFHQNALRKKEKKKPIKNPVQNKM